MIIKNLKLHNFRGFEDIEVHFHPQMTVIVGANGAGKTSIMEAAAISVSTIFSKMDGLSGLSIDKNQAHLKAFTVGSIKDVQPQYPVEIFALIQTETEKLKLKRSLNSSTGKTTVIDAKKMIELGIRFQTNLRNGDTTLVLPIIAYYGTGRLWDYHREKQSDVFETNNRLNGYIDCVSGTANIKLMMNWFAKMTIQKYQNKELGMGEIPELNAVYEAMEICYERITGYNDVKMQYNLGTKSLEVAYRDESNEWMRIPINQLSDGYKSTISLVADIAYRMAVLNPQLLGEVCTKVDGIVLIDEIDLHLHPAWQQRILKDLTEIFPKVQFIVSTHAPAVINTVRSENIIILDNGQENEPSGEVYGKDINTIASSLMNAYERPVDIKNLFSQFYKYIDAGKENEAEATLNKLKSIIGNDDPEISGCNVKMVLLKAGRKK